MFSKGSETSARLDALRFLVPLKITEQHPFEIVLIKEQNKLICQIVQGIGCLVLDKLF